MRQGSYLIELTFKDFFHSVLKIPYLQEEILDYSENQRSDYQNEVVSDIHNSEHFREIINTCDMSETQKFWIGW